MKNILLFSKLVLFAGILVVCSFLVRLPQGASAAATLSAPTNVSPADDSTLTSAEWDKADWTDVTPSGSSTISYIYESANDSSTDGDGSFTSPVYTSGSLSDSEIPTPGTPEGVWYWHVMAQDSDGNTSPWSTATKVTVDNTPDTPPPGPVFIDTNANETYDSGEASFSTIQAAVDAASAGDHIKVTAGTYAEHVVVNKAVVLHGAQSGVDARTRSGDESIVDGSDTDAPFAVTVDGVTIDGFTVTGGANGSYNAGISAPVGSVNILNNVISGNAIGVFANCTSSCLIEQNLFDNNNVEGSASAGAGIYADDSNGLTISDNEFKNHTVNNPLLLAATGAGSHTDLTVSDNDFQDNVFAAVFALGIDGGAFTGNSVTLASDSTGFTFDGADTNITIEDNTFNGGARGIRVRDSEYGFGDSASILIHHNSFLSQTEYGVGNLGGYEDGGILDATLNWWGDESGPFDNKPLPNTPNYNNPSGEGSPVTPNVDYRPWYTDEEMTTLSEVTTAHIVVTKITNLVGDNTEFNFTISTEGQETVKKFTLSGGASVDQEVPAGTSTITEGPDFPGWVLVGNSCIYDDEDIGFTPTPHSHEVVLDAGDTVRCTFTNIYGNTENQGHLIVKKVIADAPSTATSSDFSFILNNQSYAFDQNGENDITLTPGTYTITEPEVKEYVTTYDNCSNLEVGNEQTVTCTITNTFTPPRNPPSHGGGSSGGSRPGGGGQGQVLGAATGPEDCQLGDFYNRSTGERCPVSESCPAYLTSYLHIGRPNPLDQVIKLQTFLNSFQNAGLPTTGFFGQLTFGAVKAFQASQAEHIRNPWTFAGLPIPNGEWPTGYVYKTTKWWINSLNCPANTGAFPLPMLP